MLTTRATLRWLVIAIAVTSAAVAAQAGATGTWTAKWPTRIGEQRYTFELEQKGQALTGTAISNLGESKIESGRVTGNTVTFVETVLIDDIGTRRFEYSGTLTADRIKFVRNVFDGNRNKITTEEFEATRAR